ncbi:hypothetical protein TSOC_001595 [Tetrabaena socialis]|uniref:Uncharacterized protein n=1 Tax=Tetrabaena socialis TaxID=47790 RepID=A0A2J8AG58_9CHLO|nr:hypothetical protein TSOC_001595 [Tetrabaena socialis]|eukprot:PNH11499.1 hypothetical protein TSOC_001595 [Tetrabaena socialis]
MLASPRVAARPFTSARPAARAPVCTRRVAMRAAAPETPSPELMDGTAEDFEDSPDMGPRGRRSAVEKGSELKHFLPLPKPAHLVFVKPTVAVVAGMASRSSVGVKMTAGDQSLERYVIEYYARSVK